MGYCIILVSLILIFYFVYVKFSNDILSPSMIYIISMFFCTICSVMGLFSWNNVRDLKPLSIIIILFSVISFILGELCVRKLTNENNKRLRYKKVGNIEWWKIIFQILFILITLILLYKEVKRIAIIAGYKDGGLGTMIGYFRSLSNLYTTELIENKTGVNVIVSQMRKICEVMCFVNIYFIIKNLFDKNIKNTRNLGYLLIILLSFFLSILTGGRMQCLIYVVAGLFILLMLLLSKYDVKALVKNYYKQFIIFVVVVIVGFYSLLPLSGRKNNVNIVSYISFYFGTSIPSLDIYLDNPKSSEYFGEETLRGVQTILYKFGLSDKIQPISKEWLEFKINEEQSMYSNIFTSGKRYYHDFGLVGVIVCQFIFGFVFSLIYLKLKNSSDVILLIFYSMYVYMVIDQVRDDLFYSNFIHLNSLLYFLILYVGYNILINFNILEVRRRCEQLIR